MVPVVLGVLTSAGYADVAESAIRRATPGFRYGVARPSSMSALCAVSADTHASRTSAPQYPSGKEKAGLRRLGGVGAEARPWEGPGAGGGLRRDVAHTG
ncbi:hypothetical protein Scel_53420 [Streptomyces cellostaticus]|nr:hypothetical protein Scel_53420 [Streptomyces cellostaticus]